MFSENHKPQKFPVGVQCLHPEILDSRLTDLLASFKTDELSLDAISEEVEAVRSEIQARKSTHSSYIKSN